MTHRTDATSQTSARAQRAPSPPAADPRTLAEVQRAIIAWFADAARDLPWRRPGTTPWGVLVSEVMSQQTPMSRVAPRWSAWMAAWPAPADLAAASPAEVLLAWDSLGYPRRALRLQECARTVARDWGGELPRDEAALLALPGVGAYTAAAVASFAYGRRTAVLDVNVRRVLGRVFAGRAHPSAALSKAEARWAGALVPERAHVEFNAGAMELGALVCTSRSPACERCPVAAHCAWLAAGRPADPAAQQKRAQAWEGTDRQLRGAIMRVLREAHASEAGSGAAGTGAAGSAPAGSSDAPGGASTGVPEALLTAPTAQLDAEALDGLPNPVRAAVLRVRELGDGERVQRLAGDLVSDGLAVRGTAGELCLP